MMRQHNATLGGEQSGHILFPRRTAPPAMACLPRCWCSISCSAPASRSPARRRSQGLSPGHRQCRCARSSRWSRFPRCAIASSEAEHALDGKGRVVVRYSGTEALARVMIEAESREEMEQHAERIAQAIRSTLGA